MTEGDAPSDLRARVLERIATARPAPWFRSPLVASGVAASLAALMIAGVIWLRRDTPVSPASVTTSRTAVEPVPQQNVASAVETVAGSPRRPRVVRREEVVVPALPALDPPAPLAIDDIQPESLAIPQLTVAPLVTEPLRIAPPDGGGSQR